MMSSRVWWSTSEKISSPGTSSGGSLRNRGSPSTKWVSFAIAFSRSFDSAFSTVFCRFFTAAEPTSLPHRLDDCVRVEAGVPDVEVAHRGEPLHRLAVGRDRGGDDARSDRLVEPPAAGRDLEARGQALDVPLERPGMGLVEVVDVEHEVALGRGEPAEVDQVGVAAELHRQAAVRVGRQVGGQHVGRAPVERERRRRHAAVTDRDEVGHAGALLLLEQLDRVRAVRCGSPVTVAGPRDLGPGRLADARSLGGGQVDDDGGSRTVGERFGHRKILSLGGLADRRSDRWGRPVGSAVLRGG